MVKYQSHDGIISRERREKSPYARVKERCVVVQLGMLDQFTPTDVEFYGYSI